MTTKTERVDKKMQKYSVSKSLTKNGVPPKKQGLIYYTCINAQGETKEKISDLCRETSGENANALYEFLTNPYVNHTYICGKYGISRNELFRLKIKFYKKWSQ